MADKHGKDDNQGWDPSGNGGLPSHEPDPDSKREEIPPAHEESGFRDVTGQEVLGDPLEESQHGKYPGPVTSGGLKRGARIKKEPEFNGVKGDWASHPVLKVLGCAGCVWLVWPVIATVAAILVILLIFKVYSVFFPLLAIVVILGFLVLSVSRSS
jgi:hypothetical protein